MAVASSLPGGGLPNLFLITRELQRGDCDAHYARMGVTFLTRHVAFFTKNMYLRRHFDARPIVFLKGAA